MKKFLYYLTIVSIVSAFCCPPGIYAKKKTVRKKPGGKEVLKFPKEFGPWVFFDKSDCFFLRADAVKILQYQGFEVINTEPVEIEVSKVPADAPVSSNEEPKSWIKVVKNKTFKKDGIVVSLIDDPTETPGSVDIRFEEYEDLQEFISASIRQYDFYPIDTDVFENGCTITLSIDGNYIIIESRSVLVL